MINIEQAASASSTEQDVGARIDYGRDWSDWVAPGDSIATSNWSATPAGLSFQNESLEGNVTLAFIVVQDGIADKWYSVTNSVISVDGRHDSRTFLLHIVDVGNTPQSKSALFPDYLAATQGLREEIARGASDYVNVDSLDDAYLWTKLMAAEAEAERRLKCFFSPVEVIPDDADQAEIDALETAGTRWVQEAAYDYEDGMFMPDEFGFIQLGNRPVQAVHSINIKMPTPFLSNFNIPTDWVRLDKKYGHLRFYPNTMQGVTILGTAGIGIFASGSYPNAIRIRYTAGLTNANGKVVSNYALIWNDLIEVVKKMAVMMIVEVAFPAASGSISGDGFSQSNSIDLEKWNDMIERRLFGPKGSNGGLYTAIHGIQVGVLG